MFLLDTAEFHNSQYMEACFRIANRFGKKELRRRIHWIQERFQIGPPLAHSVYIGFRSLRIEISQEISVSPHIRKYTGWARHQRVAKGSKGSTVPSDWTLLTEPDIVMEHQPFSDFLLLLEDFSLFQGRAKILLTSPCGEDESRSLK